MPKVSIIVPIFNAEMFLNTCIDSVLSQTFSDFELLLIDDGSIDSSGMICDEYLAKDSRVRVFHKANAGVSSARNIGLDNAQGKYVIFIDADDYWLENSALEQLVQTAEKFDLDLVRGEYRAVTRDGTSLYERAFIKPKVQLANKIITSGEFYTKIMSGENYISLSLLRRRAIGSLKFNPERSFLEDMEFYAYILLQPLRCMFIPLRFYAYRIHQSSASRTFKLKNLADSFSMCDIFDQCSREALDPDLRDAYRYNSVMMYYWTLYTLSDSYFSQRKHIISTLHLIELQKKIAVYAKGNIFLYPIIVFINPELGCKILNRYIRIKRFILGVINEICKR